LSAGFLEVPFLDTRPEDREIGAIHATKTTTDASVGVYGVWRMVSLAVELVGEFQHPRRAKGDAKATTLA
jgi:hypothetical protein